MKEYDEIIKLVYGVHVAQTNSLVTLVKTLEEAGSLDAAHYVANLRMYAEAFSATTGQEITNLILAVADQISHRDPEGTA